MCSEEFSCSNFGFGLKHEKKELFYRLQWAKCRMYYLMYRVFVFLYSFGWLLASYITDAVYNSPELGRRYQFLTSWGEHLTCIYFGYALAMSAIGVHKRKKTSRNESKGVMYTRSVTWVFFNVAATVEIIVFLGYWILLAPSQSASALGTPFNIHKHVIVFVLIITDLMVCAYPVRLFHFIYPMLGAVIYVIVNVCIWATGVANRVYSFLDWSAHPGLAAGISIGIAIPGVLIAHSIVFGLYHLRLKLAECNGNPAVAPHRKLTVSTISSETRSAQADNKAYEAGIDD